MQRHVHSCQQSPLLPIVSEQALGLQQSSVRASHPSTRHPSTEDSLTMHTPCKGCEGKMSNMQAAHGLQVPPLMSAPSSFSPDNHRNQERNWLANKLPAKKVKNVNEHGVQKSVEQALIIRKYLLPL